MSEHVPHSSRTLKLVYLCPFFSLVSVSPHFSMSLTICLLPSSLSTSLPLFFSASLYLCPFITKTFCLFSSPVFSLSTDKFFFCPVFLLRPFPFGSLLLQCLFVSIVRLCIPLSLSLNFLSISDISKSLVVFIYR